MDDEATLVVEERHATAVVLGVPEELHASGNAEGVSRFHRVGVGEQQLEATPRGIRVGVDDQKRPLFLEVGEADVVEHLTDVQMGATGVTVRERCG